MQKKHLRKFTIHSFMLKTFGKLGIQRSFLHLTKGIVHKPTTNILNGKGLNVFLQRVRKSKDQHCHHSYSIMYESPSYCNKARKIKKRQTTWKERNKTILIYKQ